MEVESDAVSDAASHHLGLAPSDVQARDRGMERAGKLADVAGSTDRDVESRIRAECDELPAVAFIRRVAIGDHLGRGRLTEVTRNVPKAQDSVDCRHVEIAVAKRDTTGPLEAARQHVDLVGSLIAVAIDDRMHLALIA